MVVGEVVDEWSLGFCVVCMLTVVVVKGPHTRERGGSVRARCCCCC